MNGLKKRPGRAVMTGTRWHWTAGPLLGQAKNSNSRFVLADKTLNRKSRTRSNPLA